MGIYGGFMKTDSGQIEKSSKTFRRFAEEECKGSSELYEHLASGIAEVPELLELAVSAQTGQPLPNLLFGAIHYLLLKGTEHELTEYYPSITGHPKEVAKSFEPFYAFCKSHKDEIENLLRTHRVQTNEVRRCAFLYPAFCRVSQLTPEPLSLIEIGTSAGLHLLWDRYSYSYDDKAVYGTKDSPVHITSELLGSNEPTLKVEPPRVAFRIGVDLNVIDLADQDEALWLRSLIWPEHSERVEMLERAREVWLRDPAKVVRGDGVEMLPEIVKSVPSETAICVYHTHVANQFSQETREMLLEQIAVLGKDHEVYHLYNNMGDPFLHLDSFGGDEESQEVLAKTDGHARWFEWRPLVG